MNLTLTRTRTRTLTPTLCSPQAGALSAEQLDAISTHAAGAMDAYRRAGLGDVSITLP